MKAEALRGGDAGTGHKQMPRTGHGTGHPTALQGQLKETGTWTKTV